MPLSVYSNDWIHMYDPWYIHAYVVWQYYLSSVFQYSSSIMTFQIFKKAISEWRSVISKQLGVFNPMMQCHFSWNFISFSGDLSNQFWNYKSGFFPRNLFFVYSFFFRKATYWLLLVKLNSCIGIFCLFHF